MGCVRPILALLLSAAAPLSAQRPSRPVWEPHPALRLGMLPEEPSAASLPAAAGKSGPGRWWAPLASAVLPGSGQAALGQRRALPYLGAELFVWSQYLSQRNDGRNRQRSYRRLANDVARALYSDSLPTGNFEYYESMEHFVESGVYNQAPGGPLVPEADPSTFNGSIWLLARRTFWEDPDVPPDPSSAAYRNAVAFYEQRAIRPEFRWSWRDAQLEQDIFRRTIEESNDAFRLASAYLGMIIANHVLSGVDAFVTLRLRGAASADGPLRLEGSIPWAPFGANPAAARR